MMDELVARVLEQAQQAWGFLLPKDVLTEHVTRLGISEETLGDWGTDLALAAGCARGLPPAIAAFERTYLSQVPTYVARICRQPEQLEEIGQSLRVRMLVGPPPRIAGYAGSGPLGAFLRVAAVRLALDLVGKDSVGGETRVSELLSEASDPSHDPESEVTGALYREQFQKALDEAIVALTPRDKAVLRFYFVENLNIEAIGAIYGVHRATVARWLVDIRTRLLENVSARLGVELGTSASEFRSLLALVRKDLRASVSRLLPKDEARR